MMEVLLFKTNIWGEHHVRALHSIFTANENIKSWSVDREDIDNVLRIVSLGQLSEREIISIVTQQGFSCDILE